jgi:hypothetical protein
LQHEQTKAASLESAGQDKGTDRPAGNADLREARLLVACMPKSGSTFLSTVVASLPGMRRELLVNGYDRREQELCVQKLAEAKERTESLRARWRDKQSTAPLPRGFVSQHHVRYSQPTAKLLAAYNLKPVVLVRNIFDAFVSLRDHIVNDSPIAPMAYCSEEMRGWPTDKLNEFIADMLMPWYINFYVCWQQCEDKYPVTYEQLLADPAGKLREIAAFGRFAITDDDISNALARAEGANTKKNKGISGRGAELADSVKDRIRRYAAYYSEIDFSPIGL